MHRYLLNISYIGTRFSGVQKTIRKDQVCQTDESTVQGVLESALAQFRPSNDIEVVLSSRTDAGVHALKSTVHVDLERRSYQPPYNVNALTAALNKRFFDNNIHLRVINTQLVPATFHCRFSAKARTYLYRLAVAKEQIVAATRAKAGLCYIPIDDIDRCLFIHHPHFNVDKMQESGKLFVGRHDFRTFMAKFRDPNAWQSRPEFTVRSIDELLICRGTPSGTGISQVEASEKYEFWDIKVTGRSFLHRQVRRIVGALVAVAQERVTHRDIYQMITVPATHSWCSQIQVAPARGLYLCEVKYDAADLLFPNS